MGWEGPRRALRLVGPDGARGRQSAADSSTSSGQGSVGMREGLACLRAAAAVGAGEWGGAPEGGVMPAAVFGTCADSCTPAIQQQGRPSHAQLMSAAQGHARGACGEVDRRARGNGYQAAEADGDGDGDYSVGDSPESDWLLPHAAARDGYRFFVERIKQYSLDNLSVYYTHLQHTCCPFERSCMLPGHSNLQNHMSHHLDKNCFY